MATPDMTRSFDLPDRLRLAIADAFVIFSRIAIIQCIWVLEQADYRRKLQIAKEKAYENIKFVKGVVEELLERPRGFNHAGVFALGPRASQSGRYAGELVRSFLTCGRTALAVAD
ncbi:hypothetical protein [Bradyrhizobium sp. AZCC 1693]|uniref:hypothetical protein n=1 Tax=Bradyrhizobium sp. AZCC 1693 TaxID=3117029 RepID=UPI002FF298FD